MVLNVLNTLENPWISSSNGLWALYVIPPPFHPLRPYPAKLSRVPTSRSRTKRSQWAEVWGTPGFRTRPRAMSNLGRCQGPVLTTMNKQSSQTQPQPTWSLALRDKVRTGGTGTGIFRSYLTHIEFLGCKLHMLLLITACLFICCSFAS